MSDSDLDQIVATGLGGEPEPAPANGIGTTYVCDEIVDGKPCGETYDTRQKIGVHRFNKHGIKGKDGPRDRSSRATGKPRGRPPKDKSGAAPKQATKAAMPPPTDRAAVYTASLSMGAIGCYLALPPFDQVDLDICNAGLPNVGRALAQLAETNPSVARTCDLILAGGGGGWVALLMAVIPIAGGIASHHGVLPESSGVRFGEMIGMVPAGPAPASASREASPPPESPGPDDDNFNVLAFFSGTPDTVMTDATEKMMAMGGAIGVSVPFSMTPTENPDGHRGSEQLRPVEATVAEQESESSVSG